MTLDLRELGILDLTDDVIGIVEHLGDDSAELARRATVLAVLEAEGVPHDDDRYQVALGDVRVQAVLLQQRAELELRALGGEALQLLPKLLVSLIAAVA